MKKKILVTCAIIVCILIVGVFVFAGMGISSHTGLYLYSDNGSHLIIMDNSPIVMSDRENENMFKNLTDGDRILILHDGIMESYPGRTLVYAYMKLGDGDITDISETVLRQLCELGWLSDEKLILNENVYQSGLFDITAATSYSMFDDEKIKESSINADKMNNEDSYHVPVFMFETAEELETFMADFDKNFDSGYSNADDFREKLKDFDNEYFKDKNVILVYFEPKVSSPSYNVENVYFDGKTFRINFVNTPSYNKASPTVTSSRLNILGVEKSFIDDCSYFDAVIS